MSHDPGLIPDPQVPAFETYFRVRFHGSTRSVTSTTRRISIIWNKPRSTMRRFSVSICSGCKHWEACSWPGVTNSCS